MNERKDMTIEEKIALRLNEKKKNSTPKPKEGKGRDKDKKKEFKMERREVKKVEKEEVQKNGVQELSMAAPESTCGTKPCGDKCETKQKAIKELNKDHFEDDGKKKIKQYRVLGVMFEVTMKRYFFQVKPEDNYKKDQRVIVDTARGREIGVVYSTAKLIDEKNIVAPLKPVVRLANDEDNRNYEKLREEARKAERIGKEKIATHKLPMKLVTTEFTFDRSKLIFYFTADGRIDFRNLVKELATIFKLRIEMRQIGVRDEARILGSIGLCGKELCCRTHINKFDSVLIKMARDQGLVINPAKISGVCGRLLCCIKYEYQQYAEALKNCPSMGQIVDYNELKGKVVGVNPLNEYVYIDTREKGRLRVNLDEIVFEKKETKKAKKVKKETEGDEEKK